MSRACLLLALLLLHHYAVAQEEPTHPIEPVPVATETVPVPSGPNLLLNKLVVATTVANDTLAANFANDGNETTRWASISGSNPQVITFDMGALYALERVVIHWEAAFSTIYRIELSNTGAPGTWLAVFNTDAGNGGYDDITFFRTQARFLRMYGEKRGTSYGYSIWEISAYESPRPIVDGEVMCQQQPQTCIKYPQTLVYTQTAVDRRFSWSGMLATDFAQVELLEFPPKTGQVAVKSAVLPLGVMLWQFQIDQAGMYFLRMRICTPSGIPTTPASCDIWRNGYDPAQTDKTQYPRGFILYAKLPPPGGGGIN